MVYFLSGGKPRQTVPTRLLWRLAVEGSGYPEWLCEECYRRGRRSRRDAVAAAARGRRRRGGLARRLDARAAAAAARARRGRALRAAQAMGRGAAGGRAARLLQAHHRRIARRRVAAAGGEGAGRGRGRRREPHGAAPDRLCAGAPHPDGGGFRGADRARSRMRKAQALDAGQPYPFYLAQSWQRPVAEMEATLGPPSNWIVEWKFDGIRAQLLKRGESWRLWSRGEELISDAYPDLEPLARALPSGVGARRRARRADRRPEASPRRFARWPRALRQPAAAARPQDRQRQDDARIAGRLHRLRPARERGPRPSRRAAARAARAARSGSSIACSPRRRRAASACRCASARPSPPTPGRRWRRSASRRARSAARA